MNAFIFAIIIVAAIGIIAGLILAIASIVMHVPVDEKAAEIEEILPSANCGACGFSGCAGYAAALAKGEAEPNLCSPGGAEVMEKIVAITGGSAAAMEKKTAMVMCMGTLDHTSPRVNYEGIQTCAAAAQTSGGNTSCSYGCLGFGDCASVCDHDAIEICNGVARVRPTFCVACTMCVKECPRALIKMIPVKEQAVVRCSNCDKGATANKVCKVSCIGCMKCVKACEFDAIKVTNFNATVDPAKCTNCGKCIEVCPKHCITPFD
ncbi:MAG: RnfABCDGE type electron transport complex subunit B [Oscillospiraceae bacterium]|nr:RnfABCDGE type electron transport complex subunit B [Oscillospiraceae bacterium]